MSSNLFIILHRLLQSRQLFTYDYLAQKLGFTTKDIMSYQYHIEQYLNRYDLKIIKVEESIYRIVGNTENFQTCLTHCLNYLDKGYQFDRKTRIEIIKILILNFKSKYTARHLAELLFVSLTTIYNDLRVVKDNLLEYGVKIISHGNGIISNKSSEACKRRAIFDSLTYLYDNQNDELLYLHPLSTYINYCYDFYMCAEIENFFMQHNYIVKESTIIRITIFIKLCLLRQKHGATIDLSDYMTIPCNVDCDNDLLLHVMNFIEGLSFNYGCLIDRMESRFMAQYIVDEFNDHNCATHPQLNIKELQEDIKLYLIQHLTMEVDEDFLDKLENILSPKMEPKLNKNDYMKILQLMQTDYSELFALFNYIATELGKKYKLKCKQLMDLCVGIFADLMQIQDYYINRIKILLYAHPNDFVNKFNCLRLRNHLPKTVKITVSRVEMSGNYDLVISSVDTHLGTYNLKTDFITANDILALTTQIEKIREEKRKELWLKKLGKFYEII